MKSNHPHPHSTHGPASRKRGLPPGSAVYTGDAPQGTAKLTLWRYHPGGCDVTHPTTVAEMLPLGRTGSVAWLDVVDISDVAVVSAVCEALDVHPLTVEDILSASARLKLEDFRTYLFLSLRMLTVVDEPDEGLLPYTVAQEKVSIILTKDVVVTFQERMGDVFEPVRTRISDGVGRIRKKKPDYLAYALLDAVVDSYLTVVERVGDEVELLEDAILVAATDGQPLQLHKTQRNLLRIRRAALPLRDAVSCFERADAKLVEESTHPFVRDVLDHVVQALDACDLYLQVIQGLHDIHQSRVNARLNETSMTLAIIGTIFLPLTFITGLYGMNFVFIPELQQPFGYPVVLAVMTVVVMIMIGTFRRRGWV